MSLDLDLSDLSTLTAIARAATPVHSSYDWDANGGYDCMTAAFKIDWCDAIIDCGNSERDPQMEADARFVATFSPPVVIKLLEALAKAQAKAPTEPVPAPEVNPWLERIVVHTPTHGHTRDELWSAMRWMGNLPNDAYLFDLALIEIRKKGILFIGQRGGCATYARTS